MYLESSDDEGYFDLDEELKMILLFDDKEELISLITSPPVRNGTSRYSEYNLLDRLCSKNAVKCATALLEGNLGVKLHLNRDYLLHHAARNLSPGLVQLFLDHGARPGIKFYDEDEDEFNGMLPLDMALDTTRSIISRRSSCLFPGKSALKLIASLCQPGMKCVLDTIKLLALPSKDVGKKAYHCAMEGKLIELAFLLIVAREKILVPISFRTKDGAGLNGRTTILQCLKNQIATLIASLVDDDMGYFEHRKPTQNGRKAMVMRSAAVLLEVFGRAGHVIEEYIRLKPQGLLLEELEKDVGFRLEEAGFKLKDGDFDFSVADCLGFGDSIRTPIKYLETQSDKLAQSLIPRFAFASANKFVDAPNG